MVKVIFLILISLPAMLPGQAIIGALKLDKFPGEAPYIYPYELLDRSGNGMYVAHIPSLRYSTGEFVHIWQEERAGERERVMTKFNVLMDELWQTEFELSRGEEILYLYKHDEEVVIISSQISRMDDRIRALARIFDGDTGKEKYSRFLWDFEGKEANEILFSLSPDSSRMLFYHFEQANPNKHVALYYDFVHRNEKPGYRASKATGIQFKLFDAGLDSLDSGLIDIDNKKYIIFDSQPDNRGNIFTTLYEKPRRLIVTRYELETRSQQSLVYKDFIEYKDLVEPYTSHFPPAIGENNRLYMAYTERILSGKRRGTKAFQIVTFDFNTGEIDLTRRAEASPGLQVQLAKQRKDFGLKPMRRFDEFMIRDIVEMPDGNLWLVTQKFEYSNFTRFSGDMMTPMRDLRYEIFELVLYKFDPSGKVREALIIPSIQEINSFLDQLSDFYTMHINRQRGEIRLITREPSEDNFGGPDRIFYRIINLNTLEVSTRKILVEARRRSQHWLKPYTLWLNQDIVTLIMIDGDDDRVYGVTVNIQGEMDEEEQKEAWRKKKKNDPE